MNRRSGMLACGGVLFLALTSCGPSTVPEKSKPGPPEYKVMLTTTKGNILILVHREWAPVGADHFYELVQNKFYDNNAFFRIVPKFIVQWGINGDPNVNKRWADASIPDDPPKVSNRTGTVVFAATGQPNSRTTQCFINLGNNSNTLDSQGFAPFGEVIQGMDVVMNLNPEYGEQPQQGDISQQGNAYLQQSFPHLDYIKTARVVP